MPGKLEQKAGRKGSVRQGEIYVLRNDSLSDEHIFRFMGSAKEFLRTARSYEGGAIFRSEGRISKGEVRAYVFMGWEIQDSHFEKGSPDCLSRREATGPEFRETVIFANSLGEALRIYRKSTAEAERYGFFITEIQESDIKPGLLLDEFGCN